jgi:DNA-binding MarR family transcriptional regulator
MWESVSFASGRIRKACLEALQHGPRTPSVISRMSGIHLSHVSRSLKELEKRELVTCMTPKASKNRIFKITKKGKEVLDALRRIDSQ